MVKISAKHLPFWFQMKSLLEPLKFNQPGFIQSHAGLTLHWIYQRLTRYSWEWLSAWRTEPDSQHGLRNSCFVAVLQIFGSENRGCPECMAWLVSNQIEEGWNGGFPIKGTPKSSNCLGIFYHRPSIWGIRIWGNHLKWVFHFFFPVP